MKRIVFLIALTVCASGMHAQKKENARELLKAAKEPGDSLFVVLKSGERKSIKSTKELDFPARVRIVFADGSKETYKPEEVRCFQNEWSFNKTLMIPRSATHLFYGEAMGTRTVRGSINLYSVSLAEMVMGKIVRDGFMAMEYLPDQSMIVNGDTASFPILRQQVKNSPATIAKLDKLAKLYVSTYTNGKKWWEFNEEIFEYIRFYNKEAEAGKL